MSTPPESHHHEQKLSRAQWVLIGFLAVAGFFLVTEHRAHLFGFLPFLLVLACPLMHFFMHGGHGHGGEGPPSSNATPGGPPSRGDPP